MMARHEQLWIVDVKCDVLSQVPSFLPVLWSSEEWCNLCENPSWLISSPEYDKRVYPAGIFRPGSTFEEEEEITTSSHIRLIR